MAVSPRKNPPPSLELKSAVLTLTALVLESPDLGELAAKLDAQAAEAPGLFDDDPVLIDLAAVREAGEIDLAALCALLRKHRLLPLAVRGGHPDQTAAARALGLAEAPPEIVRPVPERPVAGAPALAEAPPEAPVETPLEAPVEASGDGPADVATLVIDRPLRSGQQVYARGADLVVLGVVSDGAEVIADGSIHVYGPLRGRAIAGARGHAGARIFSTCMEPQLVSIAGTYRTTETPLPAEVLGKPAQVRLDGERLVVEPLAVAPTRAALDPTTPPGARARTGKSLLARATKA